MSFARTGRALDKDATTVSLTFSLKHDADKLAALEEVATAVSTPGDKLYKEYMSIDEITDMVAPSKAAVKTVVDFLGRFGVADVAVNRNRDMVRATVPVAVAEKMLRTNMEEFDHVRVGGKTVVRATTGYSLPEAVAEHVALVSPLVQFPAIAEPKHAAHGRKKMLRTGDDSPFDSCGMCTDTVTPQVLEARYNYTTLTDFTTGNSMAVAEFEGQYTDTTDQTEFGTTCGMDHVLVDTFKGDPIPSGSPMPGIEAVLDVEYIEAVASPIPLTVFNIEDYDLFTWMGDVNDDDDAELVHSVSYGNDEQQQSSPEYMDQCNTEFMKAAGRGLSIIFASGDQGAWGRELTNGNIFHPAFPVSSPWITAVGGTDFATKSVIGDETTWDDSGGGFSDHFARPAYQSAVVDNYLATAWLPRQGLFNSTGRAYPDVAALAGLSNAYCVIYNGNAQPAGGTSAACPVFAGLVAQMNDLLLARGDKPMGFLNPWIYMTAAQSIADGNPVFHDVTTGCNNAGFAEGFHAAVGWDAATGFGTPDAGRMAMYI